MLCSGDPLLLLSENIQLIPGPDSDIAVITEFWQRYYDTLKPDFIRLL